MKNFYTKLAAWLTLLLGGILIGGGLVLHAQVAVWHHIRDEVDNTFFLWRGVGKLTFLFQDETTKAALALHEIPSDVLREADRAAWVLVIVGAVVALMSLAIRPDRGTRA